MRFLLFCSAFVLGVFGVHCEEQQSNFMIRHNGTEYDICVGVPNSRTDDGAPVIFYSCLPEITDQHWAVNGSRLVNQNSKKCMEVVKNDAAEEVIQQSTCNPDSPAQQFTYHGNGDIHVGSPASGKCVDPTGAVGGTQLSVKATACQLHPFKKDVINIA